MWPPFLLVFMFSLMVEFFWFCLIEQKQYILYMEPLYYTKIRGYLYLIQEADPAILKGGSNPGYIKEGLQPWYLYVPIQMSGR